MRSNYFIFSIYGTTSDKNYSSSLKNEICFLRGTFWACRHTILKTSKAVKANCSPNNCQQQSATCRGRGTDFSYRIFGGPIESVLEFFDDIHLRNSNSGFCLRFLTVQVPPSLGLLVQHGNSAVIWADWLMNSFFPETGTNIKDPSDNN